MEIVEEIKRKSKAKQAVKDDEIEFFDMATVVPMADGRLSEKYEASQAELRRNLAKLEEVKAMLHAQASEPAELGGLSILLDTKSCCRDVGASKLFAEAL